jgi:hypothetical protein
VVDAHCAGAGHAGPLACGRASTRTDRGRRWRRRPVVVAVGGRRRPNAKSALPAAHPAHGEPRADSRDHGRTRGPVEVRRGVAARSPADPRGRGGENSGAIALPRESPPHGHHAARPTWRSGRSPGRAVLVTVDGPRVISVPSRIEPRRYLPGASGDPTDARCARLKGAVCVRLHAGRWPSDGAGGLVRPLPEYTPSGCAGRAWKRHLAGCAAPRWERNDESSLVRKAGSGT